MSGDLDAAGAAATAALVAREIEGRAGTRHGDGKCLNCGAALSGKYCSECGQPAHVHRTLGHVFEEFLHGVVHFDTKAWRTLPLLAARPGTLTHNYIHGKRARYISPLAMFLFAVFTMYFVFALVTPRNFIEFGETELSEYSRAELDERLAELRRSESELAASPELEKTAGKGAAAATRRLVARQRVAFEQEIARREGRPVPASPIPEGSIEGDASDAISSAAKDGNFVLIAGADDLNAKLNEKLKNPELLVYKVQQSAYKFSFLLVPLSLPFVALLFVWKRGWTFYDHTVFTLYSQAFMSLLFVVVSLLTIAGAWTSWAIPWLVLLGIPAHMYFHLKGTYDLGWWSALWRTLFLIVFALVALIVFIVLMVIFGVVS
ncbi:MAG: DUF3667 domain-containing protein [Alphaproteobacteria bacterium]|nr:DUF3667 domain-containing protein [Alphaproteobacteria bacterium]